MTVLFSRLLATVRLNQVKFLAIFSCVSSLVVSDSLQPHDLPDSVHGILQARILEWVAIPSPVDFSNSEIESNLLHCRQIPYGLNKLNVCKLTLYLIHANA